MINDLFVVVGLREGGVGVSRSDEDGSIVLIKMTIIILIQSLRAGKTLHFNTHNIIFPFFQI